MQFSVEEKLLASTLHFVLSNSTQFRFYLAFENSVCIDYVTEKFSRALKSFAVPIVLKDAVAKDVAPRHSYIAVDNFNSTQDLAKYLHYLIGNKTAYVEYFKWRSEYTLDQQSTSWCKLCQEVRDKKHVVQMKEDIFQWYNGDNLDVCEPAGFAGKFL